MSCLVAEKVQGEEEEVGGDGCADRLAGQNPTHKDSSQV